MNPLTDFTLFWKNYANFTGRTPRRGYWLVLLWLFAIYLVLFAVLGASGFSLLRFLMTGGAYGSSGFSGILLLLMFLFSLALIVPVLSLTVRRLHDTGRRWYWILIPYIPTVFAFIGSIFILGSAGSARSISDLGSILSGAAGFSVFVLILELVFGILWIIILAMPTSPNAIGVSTHESQSSVAYQSANQPFASQPAPAQVAASFGNVGRITGVSGMYSGVSFPMNPGEMMILGRDSALSHIVIDQGASKVSRKHISLIYDPNQNLYYAHDYSSNGTFKSDGSRLSVDMDVALPSGTIINLGSASNSFRLD